MTFFIWFWVFAVLVTAVFALSIALSESAEENKRLRLENKALQEWAFFPNEEAK